jgi:FAD/FMN-containing dehydrogenase
MDPLSATLSEPTATSALAERLAAIVGADNVTIDEAKRKLHSEDVWSRADDVVALIVAPATTEEQAEVVQVIGDAGCSAAPRGAGMSYTSAYVPANDRTVSIDTLRMNRVIEVNRGDMTVTVQAGVSWIQLNEALAKEGLRTPFWA